MESMDVAQEGTSSASTPVAENGEFFYLYFGRRRMAPMSSF